MYLIVMKVILETQNVVFFKHNIFFFSNYSICNFHHITSHYNSHINKTISTLRGVLLTKL